MSRRTEGEDFCGEQWIPLRDHFHVSTLFTRVTVMFYSVLADSGFYYMGYFERLLRKVKWLMKMETKPWVDNRKNLCSGVHVAIFFFMLKKRKSLFLGV